MPFLFITSLTPLVPSKNGKKLFSFVKGGLKYFIYYHGDRSLAEDLNVSAIAKLDRLTAGIRSAIERWCERHNLQLYGIDYLPLFFVQGNYPSVYVPGGDEARIAMSIEIVGGLKTIGRLKMKKSALIFFEGNLPKASIDGWTYSSQFPRNRPECVVDFIQSCVRVIEYLKTQVLSKQSYTIEVKIVNPETGEQIKSEMKIR